MGTGAALRRWLVEEQALLPGSLAAAVQEGLVKVRSTPTRRTVQSAQSIMTGLYPVVGKSEEPLTIEVRRHEFESMFPNPGMLCKRLKELMASIDGEKVLADFDDTHVWRLSGLNTMRKAVHEAKVAELASKLKVGMCYRL